jgi:hypothetical protein
MEIKFFKFEADFVQSLRCVPMIVRYKLDQSGIKLSLRAWSIVDVTTRSKLVGLPVDAADDLARYREFLVEAIEAVGEAVVPVAVDSEPPWMERDRVPDAVARKAESFDLGPVDPARWAALTTLQRFALVKLTRGGHENANFVPALEEFGLWRAAQAEAGAAMTAHNA